MGSLRTRRDALGMGLLVALLGTVGWVASAGAAEPSRVRGAFITVHLEVATTQRVRTVWPELEQLVTLAGEHGARLTLQFSAPWAAYVEDNGLVSTVQAWEAAGHEVALHHHGPTHKYFDGYTNRPDLIRTDGWYATDGTYQGDMEDLLALVGPLSARGMVTAGMSDAETDWPPELRYYATTAGEDPAKSDLLSVPWQATYNGTQVTVVANAGYAIDHLGDAAVTLVEVEQGLRDATAEQVMGIVINDDTLTSHFGEIAPLLDLLESYGVTVTTVRQILEGSAPPGDGGPTPVADATYGTTGAVRWVKVPGDPECVNLTATPVVTGRWLVYPMHEHGRSCTNPGPYHHTLFGFNMDDGTLYSLRNDGTGEATLLYEPTSRRLFWNTTFGGTTFVMDPGAFDLVHKISVGSTSDSSGVWLDGAYYLGTVNSPDPPCQQPLNPACGAIFALSGEGEVLAELNVDQGFRAWIGTSLTTDGESLFLGSAAQTVGEKTGDETEYLYGCSVVRLDRNLHILASFDPGDLGCYKQPYQGANLDSVAGEVPVGPHELWAQYVRPNDGRAKTALIVLDKEELSERCRVEFDYAPAYQTASFYAAPTLDAGGAAYVPVTVPEGSSPKAVLLRVSPQCETTTLAERPGSWAYASPTLADDRYILFATDGRLDVLTLDGQPVRQYELGSAARVLSSPVIVEGTVYVLQEDGTLNVIEDAGVTGYGRALWPRYRHDNRGSGDATAPVADAPGARRPAGRVLPGGAGTSRSR